MPAAPPPAPAKPGSTGVQIVDTGPPKAPPPPTTTIHVGSLPSSATPASPPAKGSAMERLRQDLQKKAKVPGAPEAPPSPPPAKSQASPEAGTPSATPPPEGAEPGSSTPDPGSTPASPGQAQTPEGAKGKTNPWKLVENYKTRLAALEKEVADAKTKSIADEQRKEWLAKIEVAEKRAAELEDNIRFLDYSKSAEFQTKYQQPYEAAWKRAVQELREIQVVNPETNQARDATPDDLLALVRLPLGEARKVASTMFGEFADDVMAHRKEIRTLMDAQNEVLKEAKLKGAEREKAAKEQQTLQHQKITDFVTQAWNSANQEIATNDKIARFFKIEEADEEGKALLERGYQIADEAFKASPFSPTLSDEDRTKAVQLHVALRNRAAAFGRLTAMVAKLESEKAALQKELESFKGSTPPTGGAAPAGPGTPPSANARDSVFAALRAKAKPIS